MEKRIFLILSFCQFLLGIIVGVVAPLMPLYLKELGAAPVQIGYFISLSGVLTFLLPVGIGKLSDFACNRKLPLTICSAASVVLVLTAQRPTDLISFGFFFIPFVALVMTVFSLVNTISGIFAEEASRGKIFGVLRAIRSAGAIVGGLFSGRLVDLYGFHIFFWIPASVMALIAIASMFLREQDKADRPERVHLGLNLGWGFYLFIGAVAFFSIADQLKMIVLPLFMRDLGFSLALITMASAIFRVVGLPLTFYLGAISDRFGRKNVLMLAFAGYACYFFLMSLSRGVPEVFAVQILRVTVAVIQAVGAAFVADQVKQDRLGTGMALFQGVVGIGGIFGAFLTGHTIQELGMVKTFWIGGALALVGIILLSFTRGRAGRRERQDGGGPYTGDRHLG